MENTTKPKKRTLPKAVLPLVIVVLIGGGSFYAGIQFQKNHQKTIAPVGLGGSGIMNGGSMGPGGFGGTSRRGNRIFGTVTTVSSSSITIHDNRQDTDLTLAITGSTTISNNGTAATVSDIKTGDTVFITPNTSDSKTAARIAIGNPFGNGPAPQTNTQTN